MQGKVFVQSTNCAIHNLRNQYMVTCSPALSNSAAMAPWTALLAFVISANSRSQQELLSSASWLSKWRGWHGQLDQMHRQVQSFFIFGACFVLISRVRKFASIVSDCTQGTPDGFGS